MTTQTAEVTTVTPTPTPVYRLVKGDVLDTGAVILWCFNGTKTPKGKKDVSYTLNGETFNRLWNKTTVVKVVGFVRL